MIRIHGAREWRAFMDAVSAAVDGENEFYARRIVQRVMTKELSIREAIFLLESDLLRAKNCRTRMSMRLRPNAQGSPDIAGIRLASSHLDRPWRT